MASIKCLYHSPYSCAVKSLLSLLSKEDAFSLCQTATNKRVVPENMQEISDAVLLFTPDLERLFSYRKITSILLQNYLMQNYIVLEGHATKTQLISKVLKLWNEKFKIPPTSNAESDSSFSYNLSNDSSSYSSNVNSLFVSQSPDSNISSSCTRNPETIQNRIPSPNIPDGTSKSSVEISEYNKENNLCTKSISPKIRSDEFAHDFTEWFYSQLNQLHGENNVNLECMFCANAKLDIYLLSPSSQQNLNSESSSDCARLLIDTINSHGLMFGPNLDSGTQAHQSTHGLVKVLSCGTLHSSDAFVGIFEQEFGLVQNPQDKLWKIVYSKVNLKQASQATPPSLPPCSVFQIEAA